MAARKSKHELLANKNYRTTFEATVCGIPCIVGILYYYSARPDRSACNPWDYEGGTECEWELMDTRYRVAHWLHAKMEKLKQTDKVHVMICKYMED